MTALPSPSCVACGGTGWARAAGDDCRCLRDEVETRAERPLDPDAVRLGTLRLAGELRRHQLGGAATFRAELIARVLATSAVARTAPGRVVESAVRGIDPVLAARIGRRFLETVESHTGRA